MSKNSAKVVGLVLLIAVLLVAIGYAAITTVQLRINGNANATANIPFENMDKLCLKW